MTTIIQKIIARIKILFCWHNYRQLNNHGLPNEPDLMRCDKCGNQIRLDCAIRDNINKKKYINK